MDVQKKLYCSPDNPISQTSADALNPILDINIIDRLLHRSNTEPSKVLVPLARPPEHRHSLPTNYDVADLSTEHAPVNNQADGNEDIPNKVNICCTNHF